MRLFSRETREQREKREKAERWAKANEEHRQRGCPCGEPGAVPRRSGPAVLWYCERHADVPLDAPWAITGGRGIPPATIQYCRCGWKNYLGEDGRWTGSGGPIAMQGHDHVWEEKP